MTHHSMHGLVTGAGGSIGRSTALLLAGRGMSIVALDVADAVQETCEIIREQGGTAEAVIGDLSKREGVAGAFAAARSVAGPFDVLINSHGIAIAEPSVTHSLDTWDRVISINLTSVFQLCQLAGGEMVERRRGSIVNVASLYSFFGGLKVPSYTASKGGVAQLTRALANEWASFNVNVNAVAPGFIQTNLNPHVWGDPVRSAEVTDRTPAGRWGVPDDVARVISFLVSEDAAFLHGTIIPVDGGYLGR